MPARGETNSESLANRRFAKRNKAQAIIARKQTAKRRRKAYKANGLETAKVEDYPWPVEMQVGD